MKGVSVLRVKVLSEEFSVRPGGYRDGWFGQLAQALLPAGKPSFAGPGTGRP